jgi:transposase-like protein
MQRIEECASSAEEYVQSEGHRQVRPELSCPQCGRRQRLHRHGSYGRSVTGAVGKVLRILVARFLCRGCRRTVSYLPGFALSYRVVATATVEAFLDRQSSRRDVQAWELLLRGYERQMAANAAEVVRTVGCGLGRAPPLVEGLWPWWKAACGSLAAATRQLATQFRITLFRRYQCHQPAQD